MLKMTMLEGETRLSLLSQRLKVHPSVTGQVFNHLRKEHLVEVKGMMGNDYTLTLTNTGRQIAQDRYSMSQYVGPAPVTLDAYSSAVRRQAAKHRINRAKLQEVFHDLGADRRDRSISSARRSSRTRRSSSTARPATARPRSRNASCGSSKTKFSCPTPWRWTGQIINVYDSVVHRPLETLEGQDPRWIRCTRPCIAVGGEMVPEMLELRFESTLGYYTAPLQMKANNGLFIIDDFGRQMINPRDLLNRWIVPLDRGVDFLTLRTGMKIPVPFETLVVFSTNLDPRQLADEAFLRRIQNKVKIDTVSPEVFDAILKGVCDAEGVPWSPEACVYVRDKCRIDGRKVVLRACYPRDIVYIVKNIAEYESRDPELSESDVDRAVNLYFAR